MLAELLGQRFVQLRHELAAPGEKPWSQTRVAEAAGLTRNIITCLERGSGTLGVFFTLIDFYHQQGINPIWLLVPDNKSVPKRLLTGQVSALEAEQLRPRLQTCIEEIHQVLERLQQDLLP